MVQTVDRRCNGVRFAADTRGLPAGRGLPLEAGAVAAAGLPKKLNATPLKKLASADGAGTAAAGGRAAAAPCVTLAPPKRDGKPIMASNSSKPRLASCLGVAAGGGTAGVEAPFGGRRAGRSRQQARQRTNAQRLQPRNEPPTAKLSLQAPHKRLALCSQKQGENTPIQREGGWSEITPRP